MKLIFKKLRIANLSENKSKTIFFSDKDNLITSEKNSLGKSVLMKSIYHTLGADSAFDKYFNEENVLFENEFEYGVNTYDILRYKNQFAILKNKQLIDFINSGCRTRLAEFFKNELGLSVFLKNRNKTTEIAPPAYLFIPYFLDQDRSWKEEQEPFSKKTMNQYDSMSRNDLYLYHLGLYSSDYGRLKSEIETLTRNISELETKLKTYDVEYQKIKIIIDNSNIITNVEELESLYRVKSKEVNSLIEIQKNLTNQLFLIDQQRFNYLLSIKNNKKIIDKLKNNRNPNTLLIQCPHCNEEIDIELKKDIAEIYSIIVIEKENESMELEIKQLEAQIKNKKNEINELSEQINKIIEENNRNRSDYERYITRKALSSLLDEQLRTIGQISSEIEKSKFQREQKNETLKKLKEKTEIARNSFCSNYSNYLLSLDVTLFNSEDIHAFKKLTLSGSQNVRSTLAFFYAFLKVKHEYNSDSFNFPLVIDSPREGEQDEENSSCILNFVLDENLGDVQRIIASVNARKYLTDNKLSNINIIELTNEQGHVMTSNDFKENENEILINYSYFKRSN